MIRRVGLAFCLFSVGLLAACNYQFPLVVGSGVISSQSYDYAGFDRLDVHDGIEVTVLQGDGFAVEISADDNLIDLIDVRQKDGELRLKFRDRIRIRNGTMLCVVHMPKLWAADVSGASRLSLQSIESTDLSLDLSGASRVDGEVFGGRLVLDLSGASHADLRGIATEIRIDTSGASTADLQQLTVTEESDIEASGASIVKLSANGETSMSASGASHIMYAGSPAIKKRTTSGASSIEQASFDD